MSRTVVYPWLFSETIQIDFPNFSEAEVVSFVRVQA